MSREAFESWALRNTSLPSAHEMAWAAWQAALAQQEAEPIAWGMLRADGLVLDVICPDEHEAYAGEYTVPLYATPQQAQPIDGFGGNLDSAFGAAPAVQPLTDDQIDEIWDGSFDSADPKRQLSFRQTITRAIERAHGITQGGKHG